MTSGLPGDVSQRYQAKEFQNSAGELLPYRLFCPAAYDPIKKYPVLLLLHGAGERGSDNELPLVHGAADFASAAVQEPFPCLVVVPQCPEEDQWVDTPWTAPSHRMPDIPTPSLRLTRELLASIQDEFSVDAARLYITGLSMGGFGVWDAIQRWPDVFAAAVPICGGGDGQQASRIAHVPLWAFHGALDPEVHPQRSRDMIDALRNAGGDPRYTEYAHGEHDAWTETYRNAELYAWLFRQQLSAA